MTHPGVHVHSPLVQHAVEIGAVVTAVTEAPDLRVSEGLAAVDSAADQPVCASCAQTPGRDDIYQVGAQLLCQPCWAAAVVLFAECFPELVHVSREISAVAEG